MFERVLTAIRIATLAAPCAVLFLPAAASAKRPNFMAPFPCGQIWDASTYGPNHAPDPDSLDLIERNAGGAIVGKGQPVLASAAGTVSIDNTLGNGLRYIMLEHRDNWRTHYLHVEQEDGADRLAIGRRVGRGEVIGRTSNSGADSVHIHFTQVKNTSLDPAQLDAAGFWGKINDGEAVRAAFGGKLVDTHAGNPQSYDTWGTDRAEEIRSRNCLNGSFVRWTTGGQNYVLRYDAGSGRIRVNALLPGEGSSPLTLDTHWGLNWNVLMPFHSGTNAQAHIMLYNFATGDLSFRRMSVEFSGSTFLKSYKIYAGWTHMEPVYFGGDPYFIAYDSRYGHFNAVRINRTSDGFSDVLQTRIGKGFTHMVPYEEGPRRYVVLYKAGTGQFGVRELTREGAGTSERLRLSVVWSKTRKRNWSHLALMHHQGARYLFGYNSANGNAKIWQIRSRGGGLHPLADLDWYAGYTAITPYTSNGRAHLLAYDLGNGRARKTQLRDDLAGFRVVYASDSWLRGYR